MTEVSTELSLEAYQNQLFLSSTDLQATIVPTYYYNTEGTCQKQIWSIVPNFPDSIITAVAYDKLWVIYFFQYSWTILTFDPDWYSLNFETGVLSKPSKLVQFDGNDKKRQTFIYTVKHTLLHRIGPLEYCAVALLIYC